MVREAFLISSRGVLSQSGVELQAEKLEITEISLVVRRIGKGPYNYAPKTSHQNRYHEGIPAPGLCQERESVWPGHGTKPQEQSMAPDTKKRGNKECWVAPRPRQFPQHLSSVEEHRSLPNQTDQQM